MIDESMITSVTASTHDLGTDGLTDLDPAVITWMQAFQGVTR